MRILSIGPGLGRGGTERALEAFSLGYQRLGHTVGVLAWQEDGPRRARLEDNGIEVLIGGGRLSRALDAAEGFNADLIHIHRVGVGTATEAAMLRRLRTHNRRVLETNVFGRADTSEAARYIDVHMHLSKWCLWRWRRWLGGRNASQIGVVVPNPVDTDSFQRIDAARRLEFRSKLGIGEDTFVCGRIGQPHTAKWHSSLFTAFASLVRMTNDTRLLLVGMPASLRRDLEALPACVRRLVIELPLANADDRLAEVYSSLDCFLHAARLGESFGYVLTESMLCECPVVTASTPHVDNSQVEVVGHLTGGIVSASLDALPAALCRMHADSALRQSLRSTLRAQVVSRFGVQTVAELAARIGLAALGTGDRVTLRQRISEMADCVTNVDDQEIRHLMHHTLGTTRLRDLMEMRVRHNPTVQAMIDSRLARHLDQAAARVLSAASTTDAGVILRGYQPALPPSGNAPARVAVSAIMCAYNTADYIAEAVDSLLAQTLPDWELIVVDDGSTDHTLEVLARYADSRIRVIPLKENRGRSIARNTALTHASGRYIAICDSDDISLPTRFARQVAFLEAHPEVDVVSSQLAHFTASSAPRVVVRFPLASEKIRKRLSRGRMGVAHGASMLRAECLRQYGGYAPEVQSAEDLDLFCRMAHRCEFTSLPEVLVAYRHALPDSWHKWISAARHQRYARYRLLRSGPDDARPLGYDEFGRRWQPVVLNYTLDVARFTLWSIRSRLAYREIAL